MLDQKVIAVDIDGILTVETKGWSGEIYSQRTPRFENIKKVNELFDRGHSIILFSSRYREEAYDVTKEWLEKHGVRYSDLILGKLLYDVLIDDKALSDFPKDIYSMLEESVDDDTRHG